MTCEVEFETMHLVGLRYQVRCGSNEATVIDLVVIIIAGRVALSTIHHLYIYTQPVHPTDCLSLEMPHGGYPQS